jgi:hypothetical protein
MNIIIFFGVQKKRKTKEKRKIKKKRARPMTGPSLFFLVTVKEKSCKLSVTKQKIFTPSNA